jgi:hypothetical protein
MISRPRLFPDWLAQDSEWTGLQGMAVDAIPQFFKLR